MSKWVLGISSRMLLRKEESFTSLLSMIFFGITFYCQIILSNYTPIAFSVSISLRKMVFTTLSRPIFFLRRCFAEKLLNFFVKIHWNFEFFYGSVEFSLFSLGKIILFFHGISLLSFQNIVFLLVLLQ